VPIMNQNVAYFIVNFVDRKKHVFKTRLHRHGHGDTTQHDTDTVTRES